jgi:hypothetical protein
MMQLSEQQLAPYGIFYGVGFIFLKIEPNRAEIRLDVDISRQYVPFRNKYSTYVYSSRWNPAQLRNGEYRYEKYDFSHIICVFSHFYL